MPTVALRSIKSWLRKRKLTFIIARFIWRAYRWIVRHIPLERIPVSSKYFGRPKGEYHATSHYIKKGPNRDRDREITVYGPQVCDRPLPWTQRGRLHPAYRKAAKGTIPGASVYVLHGIRHWGTFYWGGLCITPDDRCLTGLATHPTVLEDLKSTWKLPRCQRLEGITAAISTARTNLSYGHWVCDFLPRLHLLEKAGFTPRKVDHYIINHCDSPHQWEYLKLWGIPRNKVIMDGPRKHFECERLVATSTFGSPPRFPKWAPRSLSEKGEIIKSTEKLPCRIYLTRRHCTYRKVTNEGALQALLENHGFTEIAPERLVLAQQIALFRNAKIIVAPNGSALANIVYCRSGTKIVQLHSPLYVNPTYWEMACALGLELYPVMGPGDIPWGNPDYSLLHAKDFEVDIDALKQVLEKICS